MREGWTYKKLGEVCEVLNGRAYKKEELLDSGKYRVLRVGNFFSNDSWYYSDLELDQKNYCDKGDLLYAWSASFGPRIWEGEKVIYHYHIWKLEHDACLDKRYFFYWLQSPYMTEQVSNEKHGATMSHLTKVIMENLILAIPPLTTQQQIVSELDLLSHILDQKRQQLKEYDALAESIFYDMFGDPVENPKGWEVKNFGSLCKIYAGGDKPADISDNQDEIYQYPVIANGDGDKGILGYSKNFRILEESVTIGSRGASIGNCRIVHGKFTPVVRLIALVPNPEIICQYLYFASVKTKFKISGAGQAQLTLPNVKEERLLLPPLDLQRSFAAKIESIEHQKQLLRASIKETEMLFQSRMDYWFNS